MKKNLFKHFIITRFNLVDEAGIGISYEYLNSEEYLSERFRLFGEFCFPSVSGQTCKNFTWLFLFNDKLPEKWRQKMAEYREKFPNIEPRYLSSEQTKNWENALNKFILNELRNLQNPPEFVLTTRLDNDDALHLSFMASVQKYFSEFPQEALISYENGLQYVPQYRVLKNIRVVKGHFGTLAEKNTASAQTVLSFPHDVPPARLKLASLKRNAPMWLEIIHKTNVFNTAFFQPRSLAEDFFFIGFKHRNLENFGIEEQIPRINLYVWKIFTSWIWQKIKVKIIYKIIKK